MKKIFIILSFLFTIPMFPQNNVYDFHSYKLKIEGNSIKTYSNENNIIFEKKFFHPKDFITDLDSDGVKELVVIDYLEKNRKFFYTLYIYNTIDTFYLADSIYSGIIKPYGVFSEDVNGIVYVTGDTRFESLNQDSTIFILPVNCWKFVDGEVFLANASVYDVFSDENNLILQALDDYYLSDGRTCSTTRRVLAFIASGFINYYNSGEQTVADKFLKKYYLCNNSEEFKSLLLKIFNNQN